MPKKKDSHEKRVFRRGEKPGKKEFALSALSFLSQMLSYSLDGKILTSAEKNIGQLGNPRWIREIIALAQKVFITDESGAVVALKVSEFKQILNDRSEPHYVLKWGVLQRTNKEKERLKELDSLIGNEEISEKERSRLEIRRAPIEKYLESVLKCGA